MLIPTRNRQPGRRLDTAKSYQINPVTRLPPKVPIPDIPQTVAPAIYLRHFIKHRDARLGRDFYGAEVGHRPTNETANPEHLEVTDVCS